MLRLRAAGRSIICMLVDLRIKNYALIEQLELRPSPLLNIITGETGAGKSIMLGAIGLLADHGALARTVDAVRVQLVGERAARW